MDPGLPYIADNRVYYPAGTMLYQKIQQTGSELAVGTKYGDITYLRGNTLLSYLSDHQIVVLLGFHFFLCRILVFVVAAQQVSPWLKALYTVEYDLKNGNNRYRQKHT